MTNKVPLSQQSWVTIGVLSTKTGVNIETIRYYEKEGILPKPARSSGGHRLYSEDDIKRLFFVRRSRELGFSIKEINSLLSLVHIGEYTCAAVHDLTVQHAEEISQKIKDLQKMEQVLLEMAAECSQGDIPECPIVDTLFELDH